MGGPEDEIDFSSYLVDLDEEAADGTGLYSNGRMLGGLSQQLFNGNSSDFNVSDDPVLSVFGDLSNYPSGPTGGAQHPNPNPNDPLQTVYNSNGSSSLSVPNSNIVKPLHTHSARNWSGALLVQSMAAGSPTTTPESTSDSSYRASSISGRSGEGSLPSTAASSVTDTSFGGSTSSWLTAKRDAPAPAPAPAPALTPSRGSAPSISSSTVTPKDSPTPSDHSTPPAAAGGGGRASSASSASTVNDGTAEKGTTAVASAPSSTATRPIPQLNLSFSYDFAHDPSSSTTLAPSTSLTGLGDAARPSKPSTSVPTSRGDWMHKKGGGQSGRRAASNTQTASSSNAPGTQDDILTQNTIPPSSGPANTVRSSRARQHSSSTGSSSAVTPGATVAPHWLSMSSLSSTTASNLSSSLPSKPYARPQLGTDSASFSSTTGAPPSVPAGTGASRKASTKRKTPIAGNSTSAGQTPFLPASDTSTFLQPPASSAVNNGLFASHAVPSASYLYRDNGITSNLLSPTSPPLDSFQAFPTPSASNASSPTNLFGSHTPADRIWSAITAPSPFDPRNFTNLNINPLSGSEDQMTAAAYGFGTADGLPHQPASLQTHADVANAGSAQQGKNGVDVDKAAALAGVGGKWFHWMANQQALSGSKEPSTLLSDVLQDEFAHNAPSPYAAAIANTVTSPPYMRDTTAALLEPSDGFSNATGTPAPVTDTIDGESPEALAARDPLATHLWRLYAKAKTGLPSGARMENITWRMMSLKLNRQRQAAAASAAASSSTTTTTPPHPQPAKVPECSSKPDETLKALLCEPAQPVQAPSVAPIAEDEERGRRGRTNDSASPGESGEVGEMMDWRQASRSRSRAPGVREMDWRAQSRSRSRAPNMRISLPNASGFQLPGYIDTTTAQGEFHQPHAYTTPMTILGAAHGGSNASSSKSPPASRFTTVQAQKKEPDEHASAIEDALKHLINATPAVTTPSPTANNASAHTPAATVPGKAGTLKQASHASQAEVPPTATTATFDQVPSSTLPMATADSWSSQPNQSVLNQNGAPSQSFDSFSTGVSTSVGPVSSMDLAQAQQALSQSVEAYLSTLGYSSSVLDIPAQRHAGSVPGLFHEQDLKVNQHAEYGFIPKLVRKTSFDASYPAALQHPKNAGKQGNSPAVKLAALPNVTGGQHNPRDAAYHSVNANSYHGNGVAQSTPGSPLLSSMPFNFAQFQPIQGLSSLAVHSQHPSAAPSRTNDGLIQATVQQTSAFSRMGAIEAFQRLQAAQALQTANGNGQQGAVNYASCVDPAAFIGNGASIPDPMSLLAQTLNQRAATPNMHIKPSQVLGGNVYGGNQFMSMNMSDGDLGGSPWAFTPQGTMTPSPGTAVASPNNTYQDENIPGMGSYASSRSSSYHNLQSTPVAIVGDASSNVSLATSAPDVSQSPKKNRTQSQNAATTAPTPASITSGTGANGNQSAPATVCVNCKTTNTPLWRRDENGQPLCNACQLFRKLHGSDRPVSLHNSVIKKRNRAKNPAKDAPKKVGSRTQSRRNSGQVGPDASTTENE